jgi:hypothetical protein
MSCFEELNESAALLAVLRIFSAATGFRARFFARIAIRHWRGARRAFPGRNYAHETASEKQRRANSSPGGDLFETEQPSQLASNSNE